MTTRVNGNILEGAALKAYTAKAARADRARQRRNFNRPEKRSYPTVSAKTTTVEYVRAYFSLNNRPNSYFVPCTYIIGGKEYTI